MNNINIRKIKIGCDLHGTITNDPEFFSILSKTLVTAGNEFHILTGSFITEQLKKELNDSGLHYTHLFSIADYYKNQPDSGIWFDEIGRPWVSDELWNCAKGKYAEENNLDLVLDDTACYGDYFTTSFGCCKIINKSGKERKPKAKMPPKPIVISIHRPLPNDKE